MPMIQRALKNQRDMIDAVSKVRLACNKEIIKLETVRDMMQEFDYLESGFSVTEYEALLKTKQVYIDKKEEQVELIREIGLKNFACATVQKSIAFFESFIICMHFKIVFFFIQIVRHLEEEADLYSDKINQETNNFHKLKQENDDIHWECIKFKKYKNSIQKKIMKLQEKIGLLDKPLLLKKMSSSLRQIECLEKIIKSLEAKIQLKEKK